MHHPNTFRLITDNHVDGVVVLGYGCQASLTALEYLMELGHTRIGYIGETESEDRYTGYRSALNSHGLSFKKEYVANVPLSSQGGYQLSRKADISAI